MCEMVQVKKIGKWFFCGKGGGMPEAVLSPEAWGAVRIASVKGVTDQELASQFGITCESIRQRRFRDPIWKAASEAKSAPCNAVSQKGENVPPAASLAEKVASTVSESIASLGESNRLLALQIASKGLKQADQAPPDVTSWQDVKALVDIVHKASGMDSGQNVQVNVLSSGGYEFSPASAESMGI